MKGEPLVVLLVEDNADHAELVMRSLKDHRMANRIYHVPNGELALDYLFRRGRYIDPTESPRPHLILLDLRLPRVSGHEVLKMAKGSSKLQDIPVVVLTTSKRDRDAVKAYELNANSYVVKPVDFAKFSQLLDDLCFYWLAWNYHTWS